MATKKSKADIARENSYRERALKMFPWVCARCGRDFDGKSWRY